MTNNTFGPSSQITKSTSPSETALTSHYVFFDKQAFADFKNYCQQNKNKLKANTFIIESLTTYDIKKFDEADMPDDLVMKIFIAINHTAGYNEKGHIGLKIAEELGDEFALKWFKLRATSAHIESCKDTEITTSISNFANIDGNIFGANRNGFKDSLQAREDVVLAQLQSALSKISALEKDNEIKQSIQNFINQIEGKKYPETPNVDQIQQATQAITYANLINAMHSVPKDSVILYSKPILFLPDKSDGKKCRLEDADFIKMAQDVVNATGRSIITDKNLYQANKKAIPLYKNSMIKNAGDINLIAKTLKEKSPDTKLIIGINGAVHKMAKGEIKDWNPSVGKNFDLTEGGKLALEESMRKLFNQLRNIRVGQDVKITAKLFDGQERQIGFAKYGDRLGETSSRETSSSASAPAASTPAAIPSTSDNANLRYRAVNRRSISTSVHYLLFVSMVMFF